MKYIYHNEPIPQEARQELNDKILYLVEQDLAAQSGITCEDIYNAYTGDGGLHGLKRSDFANYHEYSEAKKEFENGQFFTPPALCQFIMEALSPEMDETVADLTSGIATFANFMPLEANFYGCELDIKSHKVAHYLYPAANLEHRDIRFYQPDMRFDYVVGNPPFNLKWSTEQGEIISQMYYCLKAAELLKPMGIMAIVVPAQFLSDDYMDKQKIAEMEKHFSFMGQIEIMAGAFKYLGVTNYLTKVMFWQKRMDGEEISGEYRLDCDAQMHSLDNTADLLAYTKEKIVAPARMLKQQNRTRAKLLGRSDSNGEFDYQVRKMLFHIKKNPKLVDKYAKCQEYLYKFQHQEQPKDMKAEEWAKVRITEAKVLAYLRRVICSQNKKPSQDIVRLVKQDGGLVYKGYSQKSRNSIPAELKQPIPFYELASGQVDAKGYELYGRLIRRKQRNYERETKPFKEMVEQSDIAQYLDEFTVYDKENEEWIYLNDTQKHDLNLVLQKHYHLLQWEQGGGKTLAGISTGRYRMERQGARNVWVVSSAISIKNNWDLVFKNYGMTNYRMIRSLADLDAVQDGEFVIITLNMLSKYRKQIKRHIRIRGRNVCLVFDESDEMTNPDSKRTKAVLDCFRRVRFKLAMTGTVTRNNISECAPQLELLYNNSYNMLSWADTLYYFEKGDGGEGFLSCTNNPYYGKPIPAYKPGYTLFAESHLPEKITVFGVGKKSQDIFNAEALDKLLSYAVITRTFAEITGKEIRRIHQIPVSFAPAEREVYKKAVEEFYSMRSRYFALTGNSRKDSMMALIQQITLLLCISAAPNTVDEYAGAEAPVKIQTVCNMVEEWDNEIVVIGVRHKVVVESYAEEIRRRFPDRKLFVVTGSTTTLAGRRKLKRTLKESGNGILLCTQQCLPSSVNFEFVNKIIIPELHYNNARMSQFYMRFVRFTSTDWKDIYFVTYSGSIESNQMQMVLAKEKLNLFMKGEDVDLDEIYNRFGVDYDLMSLLMSRDQDKDGNFYISWGEQQIS